MQRFVCCKWGAYGEKIEISKSHIAAKVAKWAGLRAAANNYSASSYAADQTRETRSSAACPVVFPPARRFQGRRFHHDYDQDRRNRCTSSGSERATGCLCSLFPC